MAAGGQLKCIENENEVINEMRNNGSNGGDNQ
jgi:hypothetical protein